MNKRSAFDRSDCLSGLIAGFIAFFVYLSTTAPNVTLLDSGEFIVAAQHFGVPHPTGYPLWTFLAWLFQLLPLGNAAWEIALFSGVCSAIAVGISTLLMSSIIRWVEFFEVDRKSTLARCFIAIGFGLMLAFSVSVWSQAVIAEVYGLHSMLVSFLLLFLYLWVRRPWRDIWMFAAFFTLALAFSNHHLTLTLAPLPFLLILLLRRRAFLDWLLASLVTVILGFLIFAILSNELPVLRTALRLSYCVAIAAAIYLWHRKFLIRWRLVAYLPVVVFAGLSLYLYMPLASSTNPPMNWGYTRDASGFFYSFNRSQYDGKLTDVCLNTIGRLVGTAPAKPPKKEKMGLALDALPGQSSIQLWATFYWGQLLKSFTPFCVIGYVASLLAILRFPLPQRSWIYLLHVSFVLAAFLQPWMDKARIDNAGWWLNMPFRGYSNLIFAIICAFGTAYVVALLMRRRSIYFWITPLLLLAPLYTVTGSYTISSQRDRWFGWMYGHDMLKDLPKGSIMIGGTDAGRFVPTYMIFGESGQDPKLKRDPSFDRSDLYIITQNGLGESNYTKYLRDHYTIARPQPKNDFERWLGREHTYPATPLVLPDETEIAESVTSAAKEKGAANFFGEEFAVQTLVTKLIWEKNVNKHDIFIEESSPMKWTYDYATPHGLVYQVGKEKTGVLSPEIVARDFAFWKEYKAKLEANPLFKEDYDAQRSFSMLRNTIANIYRHKEMNAEAVAAYREAIDLFPGNSQAIYSLSQILWEQGDFDTPIDLWNQALGSDFNNVDLWRLRILSEERQEMEGKIRKLLAKLSRQPKNRDVYIELIKIYNRLNEKEKADEFAARAFKELPDDTDMVENVIGFYTQTEQLGKTLEPALRLTVVSPTDSRAWVALAKAYFANDKKKEFYETASKAIQIGGENARDSFVFDPLLKPWQEEPEFKKLKEQTPSPLNPASAPIQ